MPPDSLFEIEALGSFVPAPEVRDWVALSFVDSASSTFNPDHSHLSDARVGFLWTVVENIKKGRRVVGTCELGSPQGAMGKWSRARAVMQVKQWFGEVPDFIITLDAEYCRQCGDAEFMALVEHELYHAAQDIDAFGMPKFRQDGSPAFVVRGHDVEEFVGVVRRYGADASGVRALVDAANQRPAIGHVSIVHACGVCLSRAA